MTFDPNQHMLKLKSKDGAKDYLPVQWRLVWFREQCPKGTIDTEELAYDLDREVQVEVNQWNNETRRSEKVLKVAKGYARYRAVVNDGRGGRATGTKSESAVNFPDYGEKAETGAIGRALAALGYGTQFTGDELDEGHRLADAPADQKSTKPSQERPATSVAGTSMQITDQQAASIRKLCQHLGTLDPENLETMTYVDAKTLIVELSQRYNNRDSRIPMDLMAAFQKVRDRAMYLQVKPAEWDEIIQKIGKVTSLDSILKLQAELGLIEKAKTA